MNDFLNTILTGGVAVALIGLVTQLIMWYLKEGRKETEVPVIHIDDGSQYEGKIEIQQIIDRVVMNSSADRFLILKTEGGGGKPRLGSQLYASVIYESIKPPVTSVKDDYQRLLVDEIYVKMLSDIGPGTPNKLVVSGMKDGMLKNIYTVEEIKYSEVHYIWESDTAFFYLSIATTEDDNTFDEPLDRVEIEISINKVRDVFKKITEGTYDT